MPDAGIGVSLLLAALIFLGIVVLRVGEFLRTKPKGVRWNDEPPRCATCRRMVIWPDDEPLPWRLTCRECKITRSLS